MNSIVKLAITTAMLFILSPFTVVADNSMNCIHINENFEHLLTAKTKGLYRNTLLSEPSIFNYDALPPFSEYLQFNKKLIKTRNPQANRYCPLVSPVTTLQQQNAEKLRVIDLIAPFELRQPENKKAILLIHGLTDSPFLFHDLAGYFYQQGFNVRSLLLPGHGTAPADLINVKYQQWQQAAQYGIERTVADFEEVYLGGFSTGGALIFDYLMHRNEVSNHIKGLLMWSPASAAKNKHAGLARYVAQIPFVTWLDKEADSDFAKYESFPFNAGGQVHSLMKRIDVTQRKPLKGHDIPLMMIVSEADQTIDTNASLALANFWHNTAVRTSRTKDQIIYYGNKSVAKAQLYSTINITVPDCEKDALCAQVKDIAHTAPTNNPENLHYGVQGYYRNCTHYADNISLYKQCKTGTQVHMGETTAHNITHFSPMKRLTYNPYYQQMLQSISQFIPK